MSQEKKKNTVFCVNPHIYLFRCSPSLPVDLNFQPVSFLFSQKDILYHNVGLLLMSSLSLLIRNAFISPSILRDFFFLDTEFLVDGFFSFSNLKMSLPRDLYHF